jgi:hypothetical protein
VLYTKIEVEKVVDKTLRIQDYEFTQVFYNLRIVEKSKVYTITETSPSGITQIFEQ